jgi:hypothetical protein
MRYAPRRAAWPVPGEKMRPIVGVDIDGTIGRYHEHFIQFAEGWIGRQIPSGYDGSVSLARWCGVSKTTYRKIKLAYRQGGMKRSMPVYDGASEMVTAIRKTGAEVAICTTRPFLSLEAVEPDTRHWLRRNKIPYDYLMSGENKYLQLARFGTHRIAAVLDDLPEMVTQARDAGLPAILREQKHNIGFEWSRTVYGIGDAGRVLLAYIETWEKEQ